MVRKLAAAIAVLGLGASHADAAADYPTTAVADYVYACMKSNGETREALERIVAEKIGGWDAWAGGSWSGKDGE